MTVAITLKPENGSDSSGDITLTTMDFYFLVAMATVLVQWGMESSQCHVVRVLRERMKICWSAMAMWAQVSSSDISRLDMISYALGLADRRRSLPLFERASMRSFWLIIEQYFPRLSLEVQLIWPVSVFRQTIRPLRPWR